MFPEYILAAAAILKGAAACPDHTGSQSVGSLQRRATESASQDWAYETSFDWGFANPNYTLCQAGTQQSPIALSLQNGMSLNHNLTFNYPESSPGNFTNWGYGPSFTLLTNPANRKEGPSVSFDDKTVYLSGWHIHTPAEHIINGRRPRAEVHFVHVDEHSQPKAVLGMTIDAGCEDNDFIAKLPAMIGVKQRSKVEQTALDLNDAIKSVSSFGDFWTYRGSLTTPPCSEGIQWFVAKQPMIVSTNQMKAILAASRYGARVEQQVWEHRINQ